MPIRIYLEINPDQSGFLSINRSVYIWIYFLLYPDQFPHFYFFLTGNTITKSIQSYIVGNFSNFWIYQEVCPDLSESIWIDIHWIEIRFYSEVTVQCGSIRKFVQVFFYSVACSEMLLPDTSFIS
jgi:hypothetical protein